jgi:hypothetical protein
MSASTQFKKRRIKEKKQVEMQTNSATAACYLLADMLSGRALCNLEQLYNSVNYYLCKKALNSGMFSGTALCNHVALQNSGMWNSFM